MFSDGAPAVREALVNGAMVEDVALAAAAHERAVREAHSVDYEQGIVRVAADFDRVAAVDPAAVAVNYGEQAKAVVDGAVPS